MHFPFDFIFDRVIALARSKCSGRAWCSACSSYIIEYIDSLKFILPYNTKNVI